MAYQEYTYTNQPWTANLANTYIRDNLDALKNPGTGIHNANESSDYTTTSVTFTNVDATDTDGKFRQTITTNGGDIMVCFNGTVINNTVGGKVYFDITVDGTRHGDTLGATDGLIFVGQDAANDFYPTTLIRFIQNISAGSHIFRLVWKVSAGTGRIYAGAGVAGTDIIPQFFVREVS